MVHVAQVTTLVEAVLLLVSPPVFRSQCTLTDRTPPESDPASRSIVPVYMSPHWRREAVRPSPIQAYSIARYPHDVHVLNDWVITPNGIGVRAFAQPYSAGLVLNLVFLRVGRC